MLAHPRIRVPRMSKKAKAIGNDTSNIHLPWKFFEERDSKKL
jgi:hypothetical protein